MKIRIILISTSTILLLLVLIIFGCKKEENDPSKKENEITYNEIVEVLTSVDDEFSTKIESLGITKAKEEIALLLSNNSNVTEYNFNPDSTVIFWILADSILCSYRMESFDDIPDTLTYTSKNATVNQYEVLDNTEPHNTKALLLSPHFYEWKVPILPPDKDDLNNYFDHALRGRGYDVTYKYNEEKSDQNISLDDYLYWDDYGVISFVGHGAANGEYLTFNSGVNYTVDLYNQYKSEFWTQQLGVNGEYNANSTLKEQIFITSFWFEEKYQNKLDNTFILLSACESLHPTVTKGFDYYLMGENSVYWGWDGSYYPQLGGFQNGRYLIDYLLDSFITCCEANDIMDQKGENYHRFAIGWPKIYLKMSNSSDCSMGLYLYPTAEFSSNIVEGLKPLTVSFTDLSTNNPTNYEWRFGDGDISYDKNPVHEYKWQGSYTVTLIVNNKYGSNFIQKEDYITVSLGSITSVFTDPRDGIEYNIVTIGSQTWFAENLNYESVNSHCYDDDPLNCEIYGRLYNWEEAMSSCPTGWHLSSWDEWVALSQYIGGGNNGGDLKEEGYDHWLFPNTGATNLLDFNALPGGSRNLVAFHNKGKNGYWKTSTEENSQNAFGVVLFHDNDIYGMLQNNSKSNYQSVRCVKD